MLTSHVKLDQPKILEIYEQPKEFPSMDFITRYCSLHRRDKHDVTTTAQHNGCKGRFFELRSCVPFHGRNFICARNFLDGRKIEPWMETSEPESWRQWRQQILSATGDKRHVIIPMNLHATIICYAWNCETLSFSTKNKASLGLRLGLAWCRWSQQTN